MALAFASAVFLQRGIFHIAEIFRTIVLHIRIIQMYFITMIYTLYKKVQ